MQGVTVINIQDVLKTKFGHNTFKYGQEEIVRDVIAQKDVLAILPTGGGKSLCYQLPAYFMNGLVLIISPLVSLMEDQVASMKLQGEKRVVALNSFLSYGDRMAVVNNLNRYKYLFVSPEMLLQERVLGKLAASPIAYIVVDEAHCISQWGFDFRPEYLRIGEFIETVAPTSILALTATADDKVMSDIIHFLNLTDTTIHRQPLDRPNISYAIMKMNDDEEKIKWCINRVQQTIGPGIIYVSSRKRADELATLLSHHSINCASYHAGMEPADRAFIQEQFLNSELSWICATTAFGMGIHKNDVRQVIHEHIPSTIANYVQEVGRAGRDGKDSSATLLYTEADIRKAYFMIQEGSPNESEIRHYDELTKEMSSNQAAALSGLTETSQRVIQYYLDRMPVDEVIEQMAKRLCEKDAELQKMLKMIKQDNCIRKELLYYFGEDVTSKNSNCCSNCNDITHEWLFGVNQNREHRNMSNWKNRLSHLLG